MVQGQARVMSRHDTKSKKVSDIKSIPAKRLYRGVLEYARRLENGRQHRRNLMSVFQSEQTGLRHKLRDACERLMFSHPLEYGKKVEELLWRKVYYEVIQLVKSNKKFVKPGSRLEILYKEYLSAAVGYYHHLLMKLQSRHQPDVNVDWPYVNSPLSDNSRRKRQILFDAQEGIDNDNKKISSPQGTETDEGTYLTTDQWALGTSYKILLCLGDLGRYLVEHGGSRSFAERFYQLALLVRPNVGLPFNQVGTLAGQHTWWGLTAAYCYYRCLESEKKFDGADGNLQKLLDKNKKSFYQIPTDALENMISAEEYKKEHTRIFIISFLYLCDLLRPKTYATDVEITGLCKKLIDALPVCLTHLSSWRNANADFTGPINNKNFSLKKSFNKSSGLVPQYQHFGNDFTYLQPHVVLKMCSLCIINIHNLQLSRSNRSSAAICFTLAFFSHLLGHAISRLNPQESEEKMPEAVEQTNEDAMIDENGDGDASRAKSSRTSLGKKKKSRMMRRRRHRGDGDSDLSEGEFESGSDLSESEEDFDESDSSSVTSSNSELSQEEMDEAILKNTKQSRTKKVVKSDNTKENDASMKDDKLIEKRTGLELANSLANGQSTLASLKDMSQRMFQPTVRRRILLAPSFFNNVPKPKANVNETSDKRTEDNKNNNTKLKDVTVTNTASEAGDGIDGQQEKIPLDSTDDQVACSFEDSDNGKPAEESATTADDEIFRRMSDLSQYFGSLKLLCDWLDANVKVVNACAQNSKALWSRLVKLTSLMPDSEILKNIEAVSCDKLLVKQLEILTSCAESPEKWRQVARLPEDFILNDRTSSVRYHNEKDKKLKSFICELSETQQNIIRVCRIRSFCHRLVGVDASEITYSKISGKFDGPEEPQLDSSDQLDIQAMEEMRKTRLMKDMAELRLRNEVNALENQLGSPRTMDASLCLYLVPDAFALCYDLPHIRKLLASEKYFIVIPKTVIDGLDGLKKDLQGARDAIRFLETEFKKGNRFMKAQKEGEVLKGSLQGERPKLRRNDTRAWRFYRIIECCQFILQDKSEENKSDSTGLVAILTHSTDKSTLSQNQINAISAAESIGVQVYSAAHFSKLWKKAPNDRKK